VNILLVKLFNLTAQGSDGNDVCAVRMLKREAQPIGVFMPGSAASCQQAR
jgi:hypothetical protein